MITIANILATGISFLCICYLATWQRRRRLASLLECGKCGYNLHAISSPSCPECGNMIVRQPFIEEIVLPLVLWSLSLISVVYVINATVVHNCAPVFHEKWDTLSFRSTTSSFHADVRMAYSGYSARRGIFAGREQCVSMDITLVTDDLNLVQFDVHSIDDIIGAASGSLTKSGFLEDQSQHLSVLADAVRRWMSGDPLTSWPIVPSHTTYAVTYRLSRGPFTGYGPYWATVVLLFIPVWWLGVRHIKRIGDRVRMYNYLVTDKLPTQGNRI